MSQGAHFVPLLTRNKKVNKTLHFNFEFVIKSDMPMLMSVIKYSWPYLVVDFQIIITHSFEP